MTVKAKFQVGKFQQMSRNHRVYPKDPLEGKIIEVDVPEEVLNALKNPAPITISEV